jgi:drug/metabolite transporter (DMT)-like permease
MSLSDWLRLAGPGLVWGSSFYFIAEGLEAFPAATITPMRIGFGFITLAVLPGARRATIPRADLRRIAVLAVVWMAVPLSMFPFAEERVSSSVTGMLNGATPIFVAAVASVLARKSPPAHQLAGLAIGSLGIVLIALPTWGKGSSSAGGIVMILAALTCYGVALNLAVPLQRTYGTLPVMWRAQAVALVLTTPFAVPVLDEISFEWGPFLAIVALGALGTALAYVLMASNAGRLGSTRASVATYIIPVVSLLLGGMLRNEPIAALAVAGCAIALLGAYLAGRR